jgi:hypothetical protein
MQFRTFPIALSNRLGWSEDRLPPTLAFVVFAAVGLCMPPHNDTWWHLRSGQEMTRVGSVLLTERFSHTAFGTPLFHNHEWLTQLVFFGLFRLGGAFLLASFCAACVIIAVYASWKLVRGSEDVRFALLIVLMLGTVSEWAIRPQVVSLLLLTIVLHLLNRDRLSWLPILFVAWANLHGVVILGIAAIVCAVLEAFIWSPMRLRRTLTTAVLSFAAPMASPLGWHYWPRLVQVLQTVHDLPIQEHQSSFTVSALPFWLAAALLLVVVIRHRSDLPNRTASERTLVIYSVLLAAAAAMSVRNIAIFFLIACPVFSRMLPTKASKSRREAPDGRLSLAFVVVVLSLASLVTVYRWRDKGRYLGWIPMSPEAVHAIRECDDPMFNTFAAGGPLVWWVPERRVFVDSRGIEAYPLAVLKRSREADVFGKYQATFDEYHIRCAVVPRHSTMAEQLAHDVDAHKRYVDDSWAIFSVEATEGNRFSSRDYSTSKAP